MLEESAGPQRQMWPVMIFGDQTQDDALAAHIAKVGPMPDRCEVMFIHLVAVKPGEAKPLSSQ